MNTTQKVMQTKGARMRPLYLVDRWDPLPQDLLLRQWILRMARGSLKKRVSPLSWQRTIRAEDTVREKKIHERLRGKKK